MSTYEDRRLDGNAVGGLLAQIFPFEMTSIHALCAGCGATDDAGTLAVYFDAPGTVIRCAHCQNVLIRIVHGPGRYWLDLRGAVCLEIHEEVTDDDR
jgi:hypothetical protein